MPLGRERRPETKNLSAQLAGSAPDKMKKEAPCPWLDDCVQPPDGSP